MPGLGRKVFSAGEVLTAANVQGYLQDQAVMVFAGTAASGSALGTAVSEGMVRYVQDTNELHFYDGSTWTDVGILDVAGKNRVINGGFDFWQRGTSFSNPSGTSYLADRWAIYYDGTGATRTISQQTFTPGSAPVAGYEGQYFLRWAQTVAGSGGTYNVLGQRIEDVRTFAGQTVTLSFWAKASSAASIQTTFDRNYGSGGSAAEFAQNSVTHSLTTSWARYTATVSVASLSGKTVGSSSYLQLNFGFPANAANTYDIWGVQLEPGQVASPFSRAAGTLQGELAACQRYYYRSVGSSAFAPHSPFGIASSTTASAIRVQLPVTMRTSPTSVEFSNIRLTDAYSSTVAITGVTIGEANPTIVGITATVASGLTTGRAYAIENNNTTAGFIGFNAEL